MQNIESFLDRFKQNNKLPIRLVSPSFGHLPAEIADTYPHVHRTPYYFLLFMLDGQAHHGVDLEQFDIKNNQLLFILPNQIHKLPPEEQGKDYYKLGFDDNCLSLLPKQYPFLINPFNNQKIQFSTPEQQGLNRSLKCCTGC
ncbi:MAG: AraC family ligand binding domain-containing protein [Bacteroidota bacterium]